MNSSNSYYITMSSILSNKDYLINRKKKEYMRPILIIYY